MSQVAISGNASGTGTLTIAAPNTNSNYTLTLPQTTGTLGINGPAFSAYNNTSQTITTNTVTKITFNTETFDTNNNFASSRFTPTVSGYYYLTVQIRNDANVSGSNWVMFYKNGSEYIRSVEQGSNYLPQFQASLLLYLNGSTDYVEIYYLSATGATSGSADFRYANRFSGFLARGE